MKTLIHKVANHPKYSKLYSWSKLIAITGSAQVIIQITGLFCGIIIIRLLPTKEYALYTLANTMLSTMSLLSDGGITTAVMAQGGKVWQDKYRFGAILSTGLYLRKRFAIISLTIAIPILFYLLLRHEASLISAILIVLSLIPSFYATLSDSLLEVVPKLYQNIVPLQKNQMNVSIFRLLLSSISLFLLPFPFIAVLSNGIPRVVGNIQIRKIAYNLVDNKQKPDNHVKDNILRIVKRVLPGNIYYCLSGQLTIWLVSVFGNTNSIAQLGALGRLSMVLNIFSTIIAILITPRFARLEQNRKKILNQYLLIIAGMSFLALAIISLAWLFPQQILFILGKQYINLDKELVLNITGSCISLVWGTAFSLCTSRGWIINPVLAIAVSIFAIVTGIYLFDVSTITGVLYLNIFIVCVEFLYHMSFGLFKIVSI